MPRPYVPREAAAQFARTTTVANMRPGGDPARERSGQPFKARLPADRQPLERSSQQSCVPEGSPEMAKSQELRSHRHTLEEGVSPSSPGKPKPEARRSSTGDLIDSKDRDDRKRQAALLLLNAASKHRGKDGGYGDSYRS